MQLPSDILFSKQNGLIYVYNEDGRSRIESGGAAQTSYRYSDLWDNACIHTNPALPREAVTTVLMLGLAGGGALSSIYKIFPRARVSVVEYDPQMIAIAQKLQLQGRFPFPTVYQGDAATVLGTLPHAFDIIIVDLFVGIEPSALLFDSTFVATLKSKITHHGTIIANVCLRPGHLAVLEQAFTHAEQWTYDRNTFGAYWDTQ